MTSIYIILFTGPPTE